MNPVVGLLGINNSINDFNYIAPELKTKLTGTSRQMQGARYLSRAGSPSD